MSSKAEMRELFNKRKREREKAAAAAGPGSRTLTCVQRLPVAISIDAGRFLSAVCVVGTLRGSQQAAIVKARSKADEEPPARASVQRVAPPMFAPPPSKPPTSLVQVRTRLHPSLRRAYRSEPHVTRSLSG